MARLTYHEDTVKEILIRCVKVMTLTWVSNKLAKKIHRKVLRSESFPAELSNPDVISVFSVKKTGRHCSQG